jgi:hypothetical protein
MAFEGYAAIPGIDDIRQSVEAVVTWDRFERQLIVPANIDGAARDLSSTPTTLLRPGLLMAKVAATGKWLEAKPNPADAKSNGQEQVRGVLLYHHSTQMFGSNKDAWFGFILIGGTPKASGLLVTNGAAVEAVVGSGLEALIRAQMQPRFQFDDMYFGNSLGGFRRIVLSSTVAVANAYTVTDADQDTLFVADAACNFTLPTRVVVGARFAFFNLTDAAMVLTSQGSNDNIVGYSDQQADTLTTSADAGVMLEVLGVVRGAAATNDRWAVFHHLAGSAANNVNAITVG